MSIIEKIAAGAENFKTLAIEKLGISVGLIILPRALEFDMIARARAWCRDYKPPIKDADLIKVQEESFLLWKSVVHPDEPWKKVNEGEIPNVFFSSIEEMQRRLTGDWMDWLSEELVKFREEVSPFTHAKSFRAMEEIVSQIREEAKKPERFIQIFGVVYCARHGMLPTERRVKEMSHEQWWLIYHSLPEEEKAMIAGSPLFGFVKKEA